MNWNSHALISERLFQAAEGHQGKEMLSTWIGRRRDLCWQEFFALRLKYTAWALRIMRSWLLEGEEHEFLTGDE